MIFTFIIKIIYILIVLSILIVLAPIYIILLFIGNYLKLFCDYLINTINIILR